MAELSDLTALGRLAAWDQRTMMPPAGGPGRGEQLATLERLAHARATADEVGAWLDELERDGLEGVDADIVRVARRDFDRARRVPGDLAAEIERASSEGQTIWQAARAGRRLRRLRAGPAPQRRARARVRGVLRRLRPALRRAAGRLRLRAHGGAPAAGLRGARGAARAARRRRERRRAPARRSRGRPAARRPARAGAHRRRRRRLADRRVGAPVQRRGRAERQPRHHPLRRGRPAVGDRGAARVRPRALRAPDRPGAGPHQPRRRHLDVGPRVPEQAVGEPRRPPPGVRRGPRGGAGRRRPRRLARGAARLADRGPAVADPRHRRPGQLPAAHRAALRARARPDRGRPRRRRPPRRMERRHAAAARHRGARRRRRRPAGHPLGGRRLRLLPLLRARLPDRGPDLGGARARRRPAGRAARPRRRHRDPRLARRARAPVRPAAGHRAAGRAATGRGMEAAPFLRHARCLVGAP